jgi:tetratricopeptide (TPR) repeat protein
VVRRVVVPSWFGISTEHLVKKACLIAPLLLSLAACQETPHNIQNAVNLYYAGEYPQAELAMRGPASKKNESFVLNNCRLGSCAIAAQDYPTAEDAFMQAYTIMSTVNTNDGGRALAASLIAENVKVWKGEPFERAMAHYYLGIVNLHKGDYDNARAAFQNSLFKLRDYATKNDKGPDATRYQEYESQFALGYFGLGLCNLRMHEPELAKAAFDKAVQYQPGLQQLVTTTLQPATNVFLFIDYGQGPREGPKGWYNEESVFGPSPAEAGPIPSIYVSVDGNQLAMQAANATCDTLAMAQDRHWQDIDTIRKTKAVIGTGLMAGGAGAAAYGADNRNGTVALAGLGAVAVGALLAASSQADIRYWEMLPRTVYVIPATLPAGQHNLIVSAGGSMLEPTIITVAPQGDTIVYLRLR